VATLARRRKGSRRAAPMAPLPFWFGDCWARLLWRRHGKLGEGVLVVGGGRRAGGVKKTASGGDGDGWMACLRLPRSGGRWGEAGRREVAERRERGDEAGRRRRRKERKVASWWRS
jgi:hypothetical protein